MWSGLTNEWKIFVYDNDNDIFSDNDKNVSRKLKFVI